MICVNVSSLITRSNTFPPSRPIRTNDKSPKPFSYRTNQTSRNAFFRPDWLRRAARMKKIKDDKSKMVFDSLKARQKELDMGKLYKCCNNPVAAGSGFDERGVFKYEEDLLNVYLNIPETEYEELDVSNIIHQLRNGDVVKSTAPSRGIWIEHDQGGWSALVVDGKVRLELLDNV